MPFWSGETLLERLDTLIDDPDPACVDCAAYTLKVGSEYYVTPTDKDLNPKASTLKLLKDGEAFAIPPGQFAYILTKEQVSIPSGVLAFISIRAKIKWKGLINVSGFHVDPGFKGALMFSVFNAGPVPIHLRQGDPTFLIWFADLDRGQSAYVKEHKPYLSRLDIAALNQVAGEVFSLDGLSGRIRTIEKELATRITALERANGFIQAVAVVVITISLTFFGKWLADRLAPPPAPAAIPTAGQAMPAPALPTPQNAPAQPAKKP